MRWVATVIALSSGLGWCCYGVEPEAAAPSRPLVIEVRLENEAITPILARFLGRAIDLAEDERAECLVILLDTPGGLLDSTRQVVKDILRSDVPIVVYVAPSGGRAASAGVFITMASHVAAMAPGTNIGAAHPVQLGGLPGAPSSPAKETKKDEAAPAKTPSEEKAVNDTVAWARSLAELRGRNADWAERAVKESLSVSATTAVEEHAVDLMADDLDDLLAKIDGREVETPRGPVTLNTAGAIVRRHDMWWGERILAAVAHPNVAFLLLIFGFYGVLFEFYSPGWGVAGTLGAICLVMAFFALAILPVNYVGLLLIGLALTLFVAEVFFISFGALTLGGVVCLFFGGIMLVDSPAGFMGVSLSLVIPIAIATAGITFFLVGGVVRAQRGKVHTGTEALIGAETVAQDDFVPEEGQYAGTVRAHGEIWKAVCPMPVTTGDVLEIRERRGLTLHVCPPDQEPTPSEPEDTRTTPPS